MKRWPLLIVPDDGGKAWGAIYWVRAASLDDALALACPAQGCHWKHSGWKERPDA